MKIYGLDFTSAPDSTKSRAKKQKRLMLAVCHLENRTLKLEKFRVLNTETKGGFSGFEQWLAEDESEWVAAIDFPFGQPTKLVSELDWPQSWEGYVSHVAKLGKDGFEKALFDYKAAQPKGEKHLLRAIDRITKSQSPMTLNYTPVGKMFFQGAPRLLNADVSILPMRPRVECQRIVLEAYPALVKRKCIGGNQGYKSDVDSNKNSSLELARCDIVATIRGQITSSHEKPFSEVYGFSVEMTDQEARICTDDATGDSLDSVLCAVQAAWAHTRRASNYGIPRDADAREGWICDPETWQAKAEP